MRPPGSFYEEKRTHFGRWASGEILQPASAFVNNMHMRGASRISGELLKAANRVVLGPGARLDAYKGLCCPSIRWLRFQELRMHPHINKGMRLVVLVVIGGFLVGAGLNHLADRLPAHQRLDIPPDCKYCSAFWRVPNWVATVALLTGQSRCSSCGAPIPIRKPLLEVANVLGWLGLYQSSGPSLQFLLGAFYICVFLLVLTTDLEHHLILNAVIFPAIVVALLGAFLPGAPAPESAVIGGAFGFLFFWLVAWIGRGAMGAGDVKLAAFIGLVVGFPNIIIALLFSTVAGGVVAAVLVILRIKTLKSYIPYGPFLVFGGILMTFFGPLVKQLLMAVT